MTSFPYLTPDMIVPGELAILKSIASIGPQWAWVAQIPPTHLDTILIQWLCNKVNEYTGATPPVAV